MRHLGLPCPSPHSLDQLLLSKSLGDQALCASDFEPTRRQHARRRRMTNAQTTVKPQDICVCHTVQLELELIELHYHLTL